MNTHPLPTRDGYDAWAPGYDREDNPLVLLESTIVPTLLPTLQGCCVLDLGCGTGRHSLAMATNGARVTAIDFSPRMLEVAASKTGDQPIEYVRHDVREPLPCPKDHFDLITCHLVTDHIEDLGPLFREMRRVCRPGGCILNTNMHPAMHLRDVTARFIDTRGQRVPIQTTVHSVSEYVMAALDAQLEIRALSEHAFDHQLAVRSPRAEKYVGWPMLMVMKLAT